MFPLGCPSKAGEPEGGKLVLRRTITLLAVAVNSVTSIQLFLKKPEL